MNLPPGCLISAHAGNSRQQATAQVGESLRLPPLVAPAKPGSPLLQLELLPPSTGLRSDWRAESRPPLQLVLQVADQGNAAVDFSNECSAGLHIEDALGVSYSTEHGLADWFNGVHEDLAKQRPDDPWSYIETCAAEARIQRMSHRATGSADTEVLPPMDPEPSSLILPARLRDTADDLRKRARTALEMMAVSKIMQHRLPSPTRAMQRRVRASPSNKPLVDSRNLSKAAAAPSARSSGLSVDSCRQKSCATSSRDQLASLGSTTAGSQNCSSFPASPSVDIQLDELCQGTYTPTPSRKSENEVIDHSTPILMTKEDPPTLPAAGQEEPLVGASVPPPEKALEPVPPPLHQACNFWEKLAGGAEELGANAGCATSTQERNEIRLTFQELLRGQNNSAGTGTSAASAACSGRSRSSPSYRTTVPDEEAHKPTLRPKQFEHVVQPRPSPAVPSTPGSSQRRQRRGGGSSSSSASKLLPPVTPQNEQQQQQQKCRKNTTGPNASPRLQGSGRVLSADVNSGCSRAKSLPDLQQPAGTRVKTPSRTKTPGGNIAVPELPVRGEMPAATATSVLTEHSCSRSSSAPHPFVPRLRLDKIQEAEHRRRLERLQAQARHMGHGEAVEQADRAASDAAAKSDFVREQLEKLLVLS